MVIKTHTRETVTKITLPRAFKNSLQNKNKMKSKNIILMTSLLFILIVFNSNFSSAAFYRYLNPIYLVGSSFGAQFDESLYGPYNEGNIGWTVVDFKLFKQENTKAKTEVRELEGGEDVYVVAEIGGSTNYEVEGVYAILDTGYVRVPAKLKKIETSKGIGKWEGKFKNIPAMPKDNSYMFWVRIRYFYHDFWNDFLSGGKIYNADQRLIQINYVGRGPEANVLSRTQKKESRISQSQTTTTTTETQIETQRIDQVRKKIEQIKAKKEELNKCLEYIKDEETRKKIEDLVKNADNLISKFNQVAEK